MFKKLDKKEWVMNAFKANLLSKDRNVSVDDESLISKDIEENIYYFYILLQLNQPLINVELKLKFISFYISFNIIL